MRERAPRRDRNRWLSERRRAAVSAALAVGTAVLLVGVDGSRPRMSTADVGVLVLVAYLLPYLLLTSVAFSTASPERVRAWARRAERGTVLQRYVLGTAPGPGVPLFIVVQGDASDSGGQRRHRVRLQHDHGGRCRLRAEHGRLILAV